MGMEMKREFFYIVLLQVVIYIAEFILYPLIFGVGHDSLETSVSLIMPMVVVIIGFVKITDKYSYWILSSLVYPILIYIYHPELLFGIGASGLLWPATQVYDGENAGFGIITCTILLVAIEFLTWLGLRIILFLKKSN